VLIMLGICSNGFLLLALLRNQVRLDRSSKLSYGIYLISDGIITEHLLSERLAVCVILNPGIAPPEASSSLVFSYCVQGARYSVYDFRRSVEFISSCEGFSSGSAPSLDPKRDNLCW
jgi:hypothetical protein